jgi:hypothetical protein
VDIDRVNQMTTAAIDELDIICAILEEKDGFCQVGCDELKIGRYYFMVERGVRLQRNCVYFQRNCVYLGKFMGGGGEFRDVHNPITMQLFLGITKFAEEQFIFGVIDYKYHFYIEKYNMR